MVTKKTLVLPLSYNIIGCILAVLLLTSTEANDILTAGNLLIPLLGILILLPNKGNVIFFSSTWRNQKMQIWPGFLLPAGVILFNSYYKYPAINQTKLLIPVGIASAIIFFILYISDNASKAGNKPVRILMTLICAGIYGVGSILMVNGHFDESPAIKFNTTVESKHVSESDGKKHYMLSLAPLERGQSSKEIEVTAAEYEQTPVDGPVGGHIKSGYLHIHWYYLDL